jgi:hypothetical protein
MTYIEKNLGTDDPCQCDKVLIIQEKLDRFPQQKPGG